MFQENEIVKSYYQQERRTPVAAGAETNSCDCPAHVHDKELPLELEENINLGYSSHFDF